MEVGLPKKVLEAYGLNPPDCIVSHFGSGLINQTYYVKSGTAGKPDLLIQDVNDTVFKNPAANISNIRLVEKHVRLRDPDFVFPSLIQTVSDTKYLVSEGNRSYRAFAFIPHSHCLSAPQNENQVFEAARQVGRLNQLLADMNPADLQITVPDFHDLDVRFRRFNEVVSSSHDERRMTADEAIQFILGCKKIADEFVRLRNRNDFPTRIFHHDAKIGNVLFNEFDESICLVDLDTLMPGKFISDLGDLLRSTIFGAEDSGAFGQLNLDFFRAAISGYLSEMRRVLTVFEKSLLLYSVKFMTYMQAIRFLTDYLEHDVYYKTNFAEHNLVRTGNQLSLLRRVLEREHEMQAIISECS